MRRLARFLRRAWDCESGAYGQTNPLGRNSMLDDLAERILPPRYRIRP